MTTPQETRRNDWEEAKVKNMRGQLAKEIEELSVAWKMCHAKGEVSHLIEVKDSSEDQVVISKVVWAVRKHHVERKRIMFKRAKGKVFR
jgi:hypothetical protein